MKKTTTTTIIIVILVAAAAVLTYISMDKMPETATDLPATTEPTPDATTTDSGSNQPEVVASTSVSGTVSTTTTVTTVTTTASGAARLPTKTWIWISSTNANGSVVTPKKADKFGLTFKGNTFSASTDCNGIGGEFTTNGNKITLSKMMSTMMFCEGSQEAEYSAMLTQVSTFRFTPNNELVLNLANGGSMIYR